MTLLTYGSVQAFCGARLSAMLGRIAREPLLHFAVLGSILWIGLACWNARETRYVLNIGAAQQLRLARAYTQQFGHPPSREQMRSLIDSYIEEEIDLREGLALHLDRDDQIIRRRIVQKYEFLRTDLAVTAEPEPAQLQSWFLANRTRYLDPAHLTLSHIYFSPDRDGNAAARSRALRALDRLKGGDSVRAPELGDPFPGPIDYSTLTLADAVRVFGESELSSRLFEVATADWQGPFRSGYGWHLVRVSDRTVQRLPTYDEVHEQVRADYLEAQRQLLRAHEIERVRSKYTVQLDPAG